MYLCWFVLTISICSQKVYVSKVHDLILYTYIHIYVHTNVQTLNTYTLYRLLYDGSMAPDFLSGLRPPYGLPIPPPVR